MSKEDVKKFKLFFSSTYLSFFDVSFDANTVPNVQIEKLV